MAAAPPSPSSSPRLPSPPPIAEDQLGPKSPGVAAGDEQQKLMISLDHAAARRIRPGTRAEDMFEGPPLVDLGEIDSAFQLTEHLKALHHALTHPAGADSTVAVDKDMAVRIAEPPENVDRTLWLYELCRFLTQKVNAIITALFDDDPPCSSTTCPEMRASEWQYLCAVHDPPKACCAIDYCCHTLDWAANTLTSTKTFPSRLALDTNQANQHSQIRHLTNIFRRVYRIFAHAWFQHRDMFWKVEGRTGLYILFKTVCDGYDLIPEDNYTIPPEAEGIEAEQAAPPTILRRDPSGPGPEQENPIVDGVTDHMLSTAGTTKRHRHSPSVGATSVHTVVEETEEDDHAPQREGSVVSVIRAELPDTPDEPAKDTAEHSPASQDETKDAPAPQETVVEEPSADTISESSEQSDPALTPESEQELEQAGTVKDHDDAVEPVEPEKPTEPTEPTEPKEPTEEKGPTEEKDVEVENIKPSEPDAETRDAEEPEPAAKTESPETDAKPIAEDSSSAPEVEKPAKDHEVKEQASP